VRALLADGGLSHLILFDTTATLTSHAVAALDSAARAAPSTASGSLSAALIAARRAATLIAADADSVELVLVSPVTAAEADAAFDSVRGQWPGAITVSRVAARADSTSGWSLERSLPIDDVLGPAMSGVRVGAMPSAVRLRRAALDARDSAFARAGGTVVHWDTTGASRPAANAIAMGDDVVVATLGRTAPLASGHVTARWADGSAAAVQQELGQGCVRQVGIDVPIVGDLPLRPGFQRLVRGLMAPCRASAPNALVSESALIRLKGQGAAARGEALAGEIRRPAPVVPWLLALALLCAVAELVVRGHTRREVA
jgi:hypothetical protein